MKEISLLKNMTLSMKKLLPYKEYYNIKNNIHEEVILPPVIDDDIAPTINTENIIGMKEFEKLIGHIVDDIKISEKDEKPSILFTIPGKFSYKYEFSYKLSNDKIVISSIKEDNDVIGNMITDVTTVTIENFVLLTIKSGESEYTFKISAIDSTIEPEYFKVSLYKTPNVNRDGYSDFDDALAEIKERFSKIPHKTRATLNDIVEEVTDKYGVDVFSVLLALGIA